MLIKVVVCLLAVFAVLLWPCVNADSESCYSFKKLKNQEGITKHLNWLRNLAGVLFGATYMAQMQWTEGLKECIDASCLTTKTVSYNSSELMNAENRIRDQGWSLPDLYNKYPFLSAPVDELYCSFSTDAYIKCVFSRCTGCVFFSSKTDFPCSNCIYSACEYNLTDSCNRKYQNFSLCLISGFYFGESSKPCATAQRIHKFRMGVAALPDSAFLPEGWGGARRPLLQFLTMLAAWLALVF